MHNGAVVYPRALCSLPETKKKWGSGGWCSRKRNDAVGACHSLQDDRILWGLKPVSWASFAVGEIKAVRQENGDRFHVCAQRIVVNALFWNVLAAQLPEWLKQRRKMAMATCPGEHYLQTQCRTVLTSVFLHHSVHKIRCSGARRTANCFSLFMFYVKWKKN